MESWQRVEPTTVTKVGWRTITSKTFEMTNGQRVVFDTLHPDGQHFAGVIALTPENEVVIARQFRVGPEQVMDELPGGFVDAGETPEQAASRELLEETGYQVGSIEFLGSFHKDAYLNATWHAFLARDCIRQSDQQLEDNEDVAIALISIKKLFENAKHDRMTDHAAVLLAYDTLKELEVGS